MVPSGLLLATLLVAQATSAPSAALSAGPRTAPLVSLQEHLAEDAPEKLIAEAVEPTDHEALAGEPEPLVSVLARMGSDRGRQLGAIGAYWQLVSAVADYHYRQHEVDYLRQLEGFESSATDKAGDNQQAGGDPLRIAAADARRGQAQLDAIVAQHALAAWLGTPVTTPLPLPVDRPHVNAYRTYYQRLFPKGGSLALRRIDATLPLRRQEIAIRARCVRGAETALQSAETAYVSGKGPRRQLLDCLQQLRNERKMFVESVRKYNVDIGEYAVSVARPGTSPNDLVAMMLINYVTPPQTSPSLGFIPSMSTPGVVPRPRTMVSGSFNQPAIYSTPLAPRRGRLPEGTPVRFGEPTLAPPQATASLGQSAQDTTPANASNDEPGWRSAGEDETSTDAPDQAPGAIQVPKEAAPIPVDSPSDQDIPSAPDAAIPGETQRVVYSPDDSLLDPPIARTLTLDTSRYRELASVSSKIRAQRLAQWVEEETPANGPQSALSPGGLRRVTLADCLDKNLTSRRSDAVTVYWHLWHAGRDVAIRTWEVDQLKKLAAATDPNAGAADVVHLRLQTSLESAEAHRLDRIAQLMGARLELVSRLANWPPGVLPAVATAPHAGGYDMKASTQSAGISNTRAFHRFLDTIPRQHALVVDLATAVIGADIERTHANTTNTAGSTKLEIIVDLVELQVAAELDFTAAVAEYNMVIAQYVELVLPATAPTDVFLKALVLRR